MLSFLALSIPDFQRACFLLRAHLIWSDPFRIVSLLVNSKSMNQYLLMGVTFSQVTVLPTFKGREFYRGPIPGTRVLPAIMDVTFSVLQESTRALFGRTPGQRALERKASVRHRLLSKSFLWPALVSSPSPGQPCWGAKCGFYS